MAIIRLMYDPGLRVGDVAALDLADLDDSDEQAVGARQATSAMTEYCNRLCPWPSRLTPYLTPYPGVGDDAHVGVSGRRVGPGGAIVPLSSRA